MANKNGYAFKPYTVAVKMHTDALTRRWYDWREQVIQEYDADLETLGQVYARYILISARLKKFPKADFEFATIHDNPETLRQKFTHYLDSQQVYLMDELWDAMCKSDEPLDTALAPDAAVTDPEV